MRNTTVTLRGERLCSRSKPEDLGAAGLGDDRRRNSASGWLWGGWLLWYPAGRYRYVTTFNDHDLGDGSLLKLSISVIGSIGDSMKPNFR
jgi:hypothetical protein